MLWASKRSWCLLVALAACLVLATGCKRAKPPRTVSWPTNAPVALEPDGPSDGDGPAASATPAPAAPGQPDAPPTLAPFVTRTPGIQHTTPTEEATPAPGDGTGSPAEVEYAIAAGDTLSSVAVGFQTSVSAIMQRNGIANPDMVRVGQKLVIPVGSGPSSPTEPGTVYHTVGQGDTLWMLARKYHTHPREIVAQNGGVISDPDHLSPGTTLKITAGTAPVVATHAVRPGESLSSIARANGVSVQDLLSANGLTDPNLVRAGRVLVIPK